MGKARAIGVGMDNSANSKSALRWAVDNLIDAEDHLILIHVQSPKSEHPKKQLFEDTGSPLVPLEEFRDINLSKQYGLNPDPEVLDILDTVARSKGAKVVAKVYWGDPREKLCDAVDDLKLDCLVLGSRGLGVLRRDPSTLHELFTPPEEVAYTMDSARECKQLCDGTCLVSSYSCEGDASYQTLVDSKEKRKATCCGEFVG